MIAKSQPGGPPQAQNAQNIWHQASWTERQILQRRSKKLFPFGPLTLFTIGASWVSHLSLPPHWDGYRQTVMQLTGRGGKGIQHLRLTVWSPTQTSIQSQQLFIPMNSSLSTFPTLCCPSQGFVHSGRFFRLLTVLTSSPAWIFYYKPYEAYTLAPCTLQVALLHITISTLPR